MPFLGNDPDQLKELARHLDTSATDLDEIRVQMGAALLHGPWTGPDAERMRGDWDTTCVRILLGASAALRHAAATARTNAEQQVATSQADGAISAGGGFGGGAGFGSGIAANPISVGGIPSPLEGLEDLLDAHDLDNLDFWAATGRDFEHAAADAGLGVAEGVEKALPWVGLAASSFDLGWDLGLGDGYAALDDAIGVGLGAAGIIAATAATGGIALPVIAVAGGAYILINQAFEKDEIGKAIVDGGKAAFDGAKSFISDAEKAFDYELKSADTFVVKPMESGANAVVDFGSKVFHSIF